MRLLKFVKDLPCLRKLEQETEFVHCRVSLIMWITNYMHQATKKNNLDSLPSLHNVHPPANDEQHESSHPSLDSSKFILYM